jgi:enamine deaminase RidA (YjgF/YER057c/UK114 family)
LSPEEDISMSIDAKLAELGITLPEAAAPIANYVGYNVSGNLVVVSGQIPLKDGRVAYTGKVGVNVTPEVAKEAAALCFINVMAQLKAACGGDLGRVKKVLRLGGFIAAPADFTGHAPIMNGASDLCVAVFGDAGRHARTTIGVPSLPADACCEVEALVEISPA